MSTLSTKDRVSLCSFSFADGRRCRTPRAAKNPHFCFYHAQKEARARAMQKLSKDLAYFFSGDYLSACDLSTALGCLIPAVVRGDVKSKTARTVAYLAQTLMQAIHISQDEYINVFGTDGWRKSIRNSVNSNRDYLFPADPQPQSLPDQAPRGVAGPQTGARQVPQPHPVQPPTQTQQPASQPVETPLNCHSTSPDLVGERSDERPTSGVSPDSYREESASSELPSGHSSLATHDLPLPQAPQPAASPHTPLPPTRAEFAQHVLAGRETAAGQPPQPASSPTPAQPPATAPQPTPPRCAATPNPSAKATPPPPSEKSAAGHCEWSEEPAFSSSSAPPANPTQPAATRPQPAPVTEPFVSLALPPHVRRRLHRGPW